MSRISAPRWCQKGAASDHDGQQLHGYDDHHEFDEWLWHQRHVDAEPHDRNFQQLQAYDDTSTNAVAYSSTDDSTDASMHACDGASTNASA